MNIKSIILIAFLAMASTACNESYLDINTNPNTLPTASPIYVFTAAQNQSAVNMFGANTQGQYWSGQWSQSNGYILTTTIFTYNFTDGDFNFWDGYYDNLNDYQFVIENADSYNQKYLKGPAKIMKALLFQQLVDMYGNIPFTDALKNVKSLAPKFDDQKTVYDGLIAMLDEGITDTKANAFASGFIGNDLIFRGNTSKWVKFANSVKMRILMHQVKVAGKEAYIKTEIGKIVAEGSGFITGEDVGSGGATFYTASTGKLNPVYETWGYTAAGAKQALNNYPRLTAYLVNSLKASNDTLRLKRLGYSNGGESTSIAGTSAKSELASNYTGVPFGQSSGFLPTACSALGPSLLVKGEFNRPYIIMTAGEIQLLCAEAKQRFPDVNLPNTAQAYFEAGIKESFRTLGVKTAGADAGFIGSGIENYDFVASTDKLAAIATQKWIALANFSGLEAWSEYRRTNLPAIPQSVQVPDNKRPLRLYYPNSELGSNGVNVKAQGTVDVFSTKIFWDVD